MLKTILAIALATCALTTQADEASVKKAVEAKLGGKVTSVTKTSYLGLYEVYFDGNILYTDEKQTVFVAGNLIDPKTMKSVTEARLEKLSAIKFSELPLDQAIKQVRGDGKRILVTFEDPNCGYCKRLHKELRLWTMPPSTPCCYPFCLKIPSKNQKSSGARRIASNPGTTG
jgi:thiol:disulfide interchange protein DsbC